VQDIIAGLQRVVDSAYATTASSELGYYWGPEMRPPPMRPAPHVPGPPTYGPAPWRGLPSWLAPILGPGENFDPQYANAQPRAGREGSAYYWGPVREPIPMRPGPGVLPGPPPWGPDPRTGRVPSILAPILAPGENFNPQWA
jgi:hypothetical protein